MKHKQQPSSDGASGYAYDEAGIVELLVACISAVVVLAAAAEGIGIRAAVAQTLILETVPGVSRRKPISEIPKVR